MARCWTPTARATAWHSTAPLRCVGRRVARRLARLPCPPPAAAGLPCCPSIHPSCPPLAAASSAPSTPSSLLPAAGDWARLHQLEPRRVLRPHASGGRDGRGRDCGLLQHPRCGPRLAPCLETVCCRLHLAAAAAAAAGKPGCRREASPIAVRQTCGRQGRSRPPRAAARAPRRCRSTPLLHRRAYAAGWPVMLASSERNAFLKKVHSIKVRFASPCSPGLAALRCTVAAGCGVPGVIAAAAAAWPNLPPHVARHGLHAWLSLAVTRSSFFVHPPPPGAHPA